MRAMRVIALTGGIGSGKSTVAAAYRAIGVKVVDADVISRALTAPGGEALPLIRQTFGDGVFHADGTLDRAALGGRVFSDPAVRSALNALLHPMITQRVVRELQALANAGEPAALLEIPLLFETGMDHLADAVICVTAPEETRIRRIRRRDGLTREEALARIRSQNPAQTTVNLSDYTLSTDAPYALTRAQALALWKRVLEDGPKREAQQSY